MPSFKEIAEPLAKMGVLITPVRPGTKKAFLPGFQLSATADLDQIYTWAEQYPDHNAACVARAELGRVWFFEVDDPSVAAKILADTGHDVVAIQTFKVRSRPGRGHFYFRHNQKSLLMGNIPQIYGPWSVRTDREYVVAPGSLHPDTGVPYEAMNSNPIIEAPDWLIDWLVNQKLQPPIPREGNGPTGVTDNIPRDANGQVPHGYIHGYMLKEAGRMRNIGMEQSEIEERLLRLVHDNCAPPIDDNKVRQMAKSICIYEPGKDTSLTLNQSPAQAVPQEAEPEEEINYNDSAYPVFPTWVMAGTSLYEGFAKPYCETNERIDYFMWVPAAVLMLNWLGQKVRVKMKSWQPSIYAVLIGKRGQGHKSSSIKDAMSYFEFASTLTTYSKDTKLAEGRSLVFEPGSPEGLGTDMQRVQCKNAVIFYDELSTLVSKARIEGSGMSGALLKMYDSNQFANTIKAKKDAYTIKPNTYCASLLTATTDDRFEELWAQLAGNDTGLKNRFSLFLQPEVLPDSKIESIVSFHEAALKTRALMDKAVNQGTYQVFDQGPLIALLKETRNPRLVGRAEKWAFYFAIDLALTEIDEDCVERGIAMARYEQSVEDYLTTFEAKNDEALIQGGIVIQLKKHKGRMPYREVERYLSSTRYGTSIWNRALKGLIDSGYVSMGGNGVKGSPRELVLLRDMEFVKS